jgi:hypothetical protein
MSVLKSLGAVVAAFFAMAIMSIAADAAVYLAWGVPPFSRPMNNPLFALALAYRAFFGVISGWMAARLAPGAPLAHALALGALGLFLGAAGVAASWSHPEMGPRWYAVAVALISLPTAWLGGWLHKSA